MVSTEYLRRRLAAAYVTGPRAALYALLIVAVPTLINASVKDVVIDVSLTPYIPFVLIAAIFLGWRYAAFVAAASALVSDLWFIGPPDRILESPTDIFALASFTVVAAVLIVFVEAVRRLPEVEAPLVSTAHARPGTIVFSLEDGIAWASWYGIEKPVRLGPADEVALMMEDFLAQMQLGRRLIAIQP